jgi:hypothetical protein
MAVRVQSDRGFWLGLALLIAVGIFLGLKVQQAVSLAHGAMSGASIERQAQPNPDRKLLIQVADRDSFLRDTSALQRDPFRSSRPLAVNRDPAPPRQQEVSTVPVLRALLFDNVNPSVQLSIGALTSDWLREGDSFEGWVVLEIGPDSVRVSKNDESVVLSTS